MIKEINIKLLDELYTPKKTHDDDAAYDLRARLNEHTDVISIRPGETEIIPCGFHLGLPVGYEALISPRSGLAGKHGITVLNSPGIIDAGYRGEVMVILHNTSNEIFVVEDGDRIAQMRIKEVLSTSFTVVNSLDTTDRGEKGFGDSGVK